MSCHCVLKNALLQLSAKYFRSNKFSSPIANFSAKSKFYNSFLTASKNNLLRISTLNSTTDQISVLEGDVGKSEKELDSPNQKKVALLLAYNGEKYHGVMMNRGDRSYATIEKELILALLRAKLISEECWKKPPLMHFVIASRTDKGVSTCGQVISLFLEYRNDVVDVINSFLPLDIRVLAAQRATRRFSCWRFASLRVYSYTLPTFAFAGREEINEEYRITSGKWKHIHSLGYRFKGAHSFHNFSPASYMGNDTAVRSITEFEVGKPFLEESIEFITLKLSGRSFILHQIRHMIGLIIAIVSGRASEDLYVRAFSKAKIKILFAPSSGLVLEKIFFEGYNRHHKHLHGDLNFDSAQDKVDHFRKHNIMPTIYRNEIENKNMLKWLNFIDSVDSSTDEDDKLITEPVEFEEKRTLKNIRTI